MTRLVGLVARPAGSQIITGLTPWRLIELRGTRGSAHAAFTGSGHDGSADKPLRIRCSSRSCPAPNPPPGSRLGTAVAAGVGHALEPAARQAGYGVIWRTGPFTTPNRRPPTWPRRERKLGLVGGMATGSCRPPRRRPNSSHPPAGIGGSASSACCVPGRPRSAGDAPPSPGQRMSRDKRRARIPGRPAGRDVNSHAGIRRWCRWVGETRRRCRRGPWASPKDRIPGSVTTQPSHFPSLRSPPFPSGSGGATDWVEVCRPARLRIPLRWFDCLGDKTIHQRRLARRRNARSVVIFPDRYRGHLG